MGGEEAILYVLSVPTRSMILNTIMSSPIHSVAFSRNDERLSIGQEDGVLSLLVVDAEFEPTGEIDGSESPVLCHDWSFKTLAVGREDGTVTLFDTEKAFCNFFVPLAEFISNYPVRSLSFGVSERFLAIGGDNGIFVLSRKGGWALCHHIYTSDKIFTTRWSPAGRYLALAGTNDSFQVYDTISWVAMNEVKQALASTPSGRPATVACLDWSLDCRWMAVGSMGSGIIVLSTTDWKRLGPSSDGLSLSPSNESAE
jgi:WD40 repeat protein